jgi:hypothetical protein
MFSFAFVSFSSQDERVVPLVLAGTSRRVREKDSKNSQTATGSTASIAQKWKSMFREVE